MITKITSIVENTTRCGCATAHGLLLYVETERTESTITSTESTIFKWIPILIIVAAMLIIFVDKPMWRAACVTTIAFLITLLVVDSNSHSRIVNYDKALKEARNAETESNSLLL